MQMEEVRHALTFRARPPPTVEGTNANDEKLERLMSYLEKAEASAEKVVKPVTVPPGYLGEARNGLRWGYGVQVRVRISCVMCIFSCFSYSCAQV